MGVIHRCNIRRIDRHGLARRVHHVRRNPKRCDRPQRPIRIDYCLRESCHLLCGVRRGWPCVESIHARIAAKVRVESHSRSPSRWAGAYRHIRQCCQSLLLRNTHPQADLAKRDQHRRYSQTTHVCISLEPRERVFVHPGLYVNWFPHRGGSPRSAGR